MHAGAGVSQRLDASALLSRDHWSLAALRRIDASAPEFAGSEFGGNTFSQREVAARLRAAVARLPDSVAWGRLARAYLERFEEEFPRTDETPVTRARLTGAAVSAGLLGAEGRARPGNGWFIDEDWTGAQPLEDLASPWASFALSGALHRRLAGQLSARADGRYKTLDHSHALVRAGAIEVWAGRRAPGFGPGFTGIVLGGNTQINAAGLLIRSPLRLPWLLRYLGPLRFETFLSRFPQNGRVQEPWFWAARGSVQPLRQVTLGINRAAIFGGAGNPFRLIDVLEMMAGGYGGEGGEFENQVVSVDLRIVVPEALPFELNVEWGSDDGAGMWYRAPALNVGLRMHALPVAPAAFGAFEWTLFSGKPPNRNTYWYRNVFFRGSWSLGETPLGHPLGGHGHEYNVRLGTDLLDARLRLQANVYARDRGAENIYAPERAGRSVGWGGHGVWRAGRTELELTAGSEYGSGWRERALRAGLRRLF
jgi:hypothetical protein